VISLSLSNLIKNILNIQDNNISFPEEKYCVILQHIRELHRFYGEEKGYRIARKHIAWYLQDIQPDSVFKQDFNALTSASAQLSALERFFSLI